MLNLKRVVFCAVLTTVTVMTVDRWIESRLDSPPPQPMALPQGAAIPAFNLPTTSGRRLSSREFAGKLWILTIASCSCTLSPATAVALKNVQSKWGAQVPILSLYVREAHPNPDFPQIWTVSRSVVHAKHYQIREKLTWPVAIDSVSGRLYKELGQTPNGTYIIDGKGRIVRSYAWSPEADTFNNDLRMLTSVTRHQAGAAPAGLL